MTRAQQDQLARITQELERTERSIRELEQRPGQHQSLKLAMLHARLGQKRWQYERLLAELNLVPVPSGTKQDSHYITRV